MSIENNRIQDYEQFKVEVLATIKPYLPDDFRDVTMTIESVLKVNEKKETIRFFGIEGQHITPTLYVDEMFKRYVQTGDLESTIQEYVSAAFGDRETLELIKSNIGDLMNPDRVIGMLVNAERNQEMLAESPHRLDGDVAMVYKVCVSITDEGVATAHINNAAAKELGLTEKELFDLAVKNTPRLFPPRVVTMSEILFGNMRDSGMPDEMIEMMCADTEMAQMYVITNQSGVNGAVSIIFPEVLRDLAEKVESNLFLLPSSKHEWIAVPESPGYSAEELRGLVGEVNSTVLDERDFLSDSVYTYDRTEDKVYMLDDSGKRIETMDVIPEGPKR